MAREFPRLRHPIVQAPLAGGPSTPALAAAVSDAGGLGFLAAGYKAPDDLRADISTLRQLTSAPFGVNLFLLTEAPVKDAAISRYAEALDGERTRHASVLGRPRFDDDAFAAKLEIVLDQRPSVVSFTFGCPSAEIVARLHDRLRIATLHLGQAGLDAFIVRTRALPAYEQAAQRLAASDTERRRASIEAVCALSIDWYFESFPPGHVGPVDTPAAVQRANVGTLQRIRRRARRR